MMSNTHPKSPVAVRDAATIAVLRDGGDAGLEVLLLRRHGGHVFGAGADVFPGGAVDATDRVVATGHGADRGDAAWRMAALRECFEEAGLVVGTSITPPVPGRVAQWRDALNAGRCHWSAVIEGLALAFDLAAPVAFARWTTPEGAPKRYATRFYAIAAPVGQQPTPDGHETVAAEWVAPARALDDAAAGRRRLMLPTRATLERLTHYDDTASALAGLAQGAP